MSLVKNFRNLAFLILAAGVFPALWILTASGVISLPDIVLGATISLETLMVQFYFRKKPAQEAS
jgi:hypothetical protein